ncbi:MAG: DUF4424 family protein [Hyphomicrobiaceae bacterium]
MTRWYRPSRVAVLALSCWLGQALPATAETATMVPAGGLLLIADERLVVEAQEVILGRESVKATYAVRNTSSEAVVRIVSWRLPEIDANALGDEVVQLASPDPKNFAAAGVAVDGVNVSLAFEQRAIAFGRDVTALLEAQALPLNPIVSGVEGRLLALPPEQKSAFEERGIVRSEPPRAFANWSVHTTGFWRQTFPPGKLVTMSLAYRPMTGVRAWTSHSLQDLRQSYCIDQAKAAEIAAKAARSGKLTAYQLTYVVTNEPGWWTAIPKFRLAIERTDLDTITATCQKGFRNVGPTLVESIAEGWQPIDDIRVLFIR